MKKLIALLLIPMVLAGCEPEQERDARHDKMCKGYGAKEGTPEYIQCRATIHLTERLQEDQQALAGANIAISSAAIGMNVGRR